MLLLQSQNQFLQSELQQYLTSLSDVEDTMAKQMAQIKELQLQATSVKSDVDAQVMMGPWTERCVA
jgi:hypothetical protein